MPEPFVKYCSDAYLPSLGGRRRPKKDSKNIALRNAGFRGYADYMKTREFGEGIDQILMLAGEARCAAMCPEARWWQCHRSLICDHLKVLGHRVLHIRSDGGLQEHPITSAARVVEGSLTYESSDQQEF